jgi:hypothetical protein
MNYSMSVDHFINTSFLSDFEDYPLVFLQVADSAASYADKVVKVLEWEPKITSLRVQEYETIQIIAKNGFEFTAAYSTRSYSKIEAVINICRTTYVCLVLSFAAIFFNKDAQTLVLDPLERMIEKVKLMAQNPLAAATDEVENAGVYNFLNQVDKSQAQNEEAKHYETAVLERAIVKIGHLLALGLGEAGGLIIA